jgi:hypothetical protein
LNSQRNKNQDALHKTLTMLLLIIGSVAPMAIAFILVASTNHGGNPLDKIPDYETLPTETLVVPFDRGEATITQYQYWDKVRIVVEGTGQAGGTAYSDAFYLYTDANGQPLEIPQTAMFDLEIDGQRAIERIEGDPRSSLRGAGRRRAARASPRLSDFRRGRRRQHRSVHDHGRAA